MTTKRLSPSLSISILVVMTTMVMLTAQAGAFAVAPTSRAAAGATATASRSRSVQQLFMANDEDMMRWARSSRSASANDRVVELKRPLGLVLNEDDNGNVYVETIAPKGNAARAGGVRYVLGH
jgi:hypothetical protein